MPRWIKLQTKIIESTFHFETNPKLHLASPKGYSPSTPDHTIRYVAIGFLAIAVLLFTLLTSSAIFTPKVHTFNVRSGSFTVAPETFLTINFTVPEGAFCPELRGNFTALGSTENDIIVMMMGQTSYANWLNNKQKEFCYFSGRVSTGKITGYLIEPGTYYIVFDNTFSNQAAKTVTAQIDVTYKQ